MLKDYQLVPSDKVSVMEYSGSGSMLMRISFGSDAYEWTMNNTNVTKAANRISCGPLACYHLLQILDLSSFQVMH